MSPRCSSFHDRSRSWASLPDTREPRETVPALPAHARAPVERAQNRAATDIDALNAGLGHIGAAVARRAETFRLQVSWWGPREKAAPWLRAADLLTLANESDILVVACRADASNRGLISRQVIEAVGPAGLIVNVARGSVVDEDALIAALKDGRLWRAGLDVFAEEPTPPARWADVPNAVLTPHAAGASTDSVPRLVAQAVENVHCFLAGRPLLSPVDA